MTKTVLLTKRLYACYKTHNVPLVCNCSKCGKSLNLGELVVSRHGAKSKTKLYHEKCWLSMFV